MVVKNIENDAGRIKISNGHQMVVRDELGAAGICCADYADTGESSRSGNVWCSCYSRNIYQLYPDTDGAGAGDGINPKTKFTSDASGFNVLGNIDAEHDFAWLEYWIQWMVGKDEPVARIGTGDHIALLGNSNAGIDHCAGITLAPKYEFP